MNKTATPRDAERVNTNREELIERISRTVSEDGGKELFPGFFLARGSTPSESLHKVYQPAFCLVAQGRKRALLGEEVFRYDPGHYLLFTVDLPLIFQIEKATPDEPYLGLRLDLDPSLVASVVMEYVLHHRPPFAILARVQRLLTWHAMRPPFLGFRVRRHFRHVGPNGAPMFHYEALYVLVHQLALRSSEIPVSPYLR